MTLHWPGGLLSWLGGSSYFPGGDEDKLFELGEIWENGADELRQLIPELERAHAAAMAALEGEAAQAFDAQFQLVFGGDASAENIAKFMEALAATAKKAGQQVEYTKAMIIAMSVIAIGQLLLLLPLLWNIFTAAMAMVRLAILRALFITSLRRALLMLIQDLLREIGALLAKNTLKKMTVGRLVLALGAGVGLPAGTDLGIQYWQNQRGRRDGYDFKQTTMAGASGLVGTVAGLGAKGALGRGLSHFSGPAARLGATPHAFLNAGLGMTTNFGSAAFGNLIALQTPWAASRLGVSNEWFGLGANDPKPSLAYDTAMVFGPAIAPGAAGIHEAVLSAPHSIDAALHAPNITAAGLDHASLADHTNLADHTGLTGQHTSSLGDQTLAGNEVRSFQGASGTPDAVPVSQHAAAPAPTSAPTATPAAPGVQPTAAHPAASAPAAPTGTPHSQATVSNQSAPVAGREVASSASGTQPPGTPTARVADSTAAPENRGVIRRVLGQEISGLYESAPEKHGLADEAARPREEIDAGRRDSGGPDSGRDVVTEPDSVPEAPADRRTTTGPEVRDESEAPATPRSRPLEENQPDRPAPERPPAELDRPGEGTPRPHPDRPGEQAPESRRGQHDADTTERPPRPRGGEPEPVDAQDQHGRTGGDDAAEIPGRHPERSSDHDVVRTPEQRIERLHQLIDDYRDQQRSLDDAADGHLPGVEDAPDWVPAGEHTPLFDGTDLSPQDRAALREFWDGLTPDEQRYLYTQEPMFGENAELPVTVCNEHAQQALHDLQSNLIEDIRMRAMLEGADPLDAHAWQRFATPDEWNQLQIYKDLLDSVAPRDGGPPRFLLGFELDGRSITALGNPDTAGHTLVFAPGTFTTHDTLNPYAERPGFKNWFGLKERFEKPGYMEVSRRIHQQLGREFGPDNVAVVDYQNYHAPQSLYNPVTGAANARFAHEGAPALRNHLDRLQHTNGVEGNQVWVAGHSYGTVLVGEAAQGHHGLNADGIINLGSPGLRVDDVSGLMLKGNHLTPGDAPVHTMTRSDDPIRFVDKARAWGLDRFGIGHGLMPHHGEFGGHVWNVDGASHRDPHNAYFDRGSPAIRNIADIMAGEEPPRRAPQPGPAPDGSQPTVRRGPHAGEDIGDGPQRPHPSPDATDTTRTPQHRGVDTHRDADVAGTSDHSLPGDHADAGDSTPARPDPAEAVMPVLERYGVSREEFQAMQELAAEVGRDGLVDHFTTEQLQMMYEARMAHPHPGLADVIQKVIGEAGVKAILEQIANPGSEYAGGGPYKANDVSGCVTVASDTAGLRTPTELLRGLRLDYGEWSPYETFTTTDHAYVIEGRVEAGGEFSVPNGRIADHLGVRDPHIKDLPDDAGGPPHTGTGYTGDRHGLNPEYQLKRGKWKPGATLFRVDPDGSRHPVARVDNENTWVSVKEPADPVVDGWPTHEGGEWVFPDSPQHGPHPDSPDSPTHRGAEPGGLPPDTGPPHLAGTDPAAAARAFETSVFDTDAGVAFFDPADHTMRAAAGDVPHFPGEFTVDVHGDAHTVKVIDAAGVEHTMTAREFAQVLREHTGWDGYSPIRLLSCDTGVGPHSFAAHLARELGVEVIAPDRPVWTFPDGRDPVVTGFERNPHGELVPRIPPDGGWHRFTPDGSVHRASEAAGSDRGAGDHVGDAHPRAPIPEDTSAHRAGDDTHTHPEGTPVEPAHARDIANEALWKRDPPLHPTELARHRLADALFGDQRAADNAHWWSGLSEREQHALIDTYPHAIGNAEGVSPAARTAANEHLLESRRDELQARKDSGGRLGFGERRELQTLDRLHAALDDARAKLGPGDQLHILAFDPQAFGGDGRMVVSVGADPYHADSVSWHVPGYSTTIKSLDVNLGNAIEHLDAVRESDADVTAASIAWIGYDAPQGLKGLWDVARSKLAHAGGEILHADLKAFNAARDALAGDGSHFANNHVFGHSYGSTTTAHAGAGGRLAGEVDSITLLGSPGAGPVLHASEFGVGDNVYVASSSRDWVTTFGDTGSGRFLGFGLGHDPALSSWHGLRIRAEFPAHMDRLSSFFTHTSYYDHVVAPSDGFAGVRSESGTNFGHIAAGHPDRLTFEGHRTESQRGWGSTRLEPALDRRLHDAGFGEVKPWDPGWHAQYGETAAGHGDGHGPVHDGQPSSQPPGEHPPAHGAEHPDSRCAHHLSDYFASEFNRPAPSLPEPGPRGIHLRDAFAAWGSAARLESYGAIHDHLLAAGDGEKAMLGSNWADSPGRGGHAYGAENRGGRIYLVEFGPDGSAHRSGWPPQWGERAVDKTAVAYFDRHGNPTDPLTGRHGELAAADAVGEVAGRRGGDGGWSDLVKAHDAQRTALDQSHQVQQARLDGEHARQIRQEGRSPELAQRHQQEQSQLLRVQQEQLARLGQVHRAEIRQFAEMHQERGSHTAADRDVADGRTNTPTELGESHLPEDPVLRARAVDETVQQARDVHKSRVQEVQRLEGEKGALEEQRDDKMRQRRRTGADKVTLDREIADLKDRIRTVDQELEAAARLADESRAPLEANGRLEYWEGRLAAERVVPATDGVELRGFRARLDEQVPAFDGQQARVRELAYRLGHVEAELKKAMARADIERLTGQRDRLKADLGKARTKLADSGYGVLDTANHEDRAAFERQPETVREAQLERQVAEARRQLEARCAEFAALERARADAAGGDTAAAKHLSRVEEVCARQRNIDADARIRALIDRVDRQNLQSRIRVDERNRAEYPGSEPDPWVLREQISDQERVRRWPLLDLQQLRHTIAERLGAGVEWQFRRQMLGLTRCTPHEVVDALSVFHDDGVRPDRGGNASARDSHEAALGDQLRGELAGEADRLVAAGVYENREHFLADVVGAEMKRLAALHEQDGAGGGADNIPSILGLTVLGDRSINSSLGSLWTSRILDGQHNPIRVYELVRRLAQAQIDAGRGHEKFDIWYTNLT